MKYNVVKMFDAENVADAIAIESQFPPTDVFISQKEWDENNYDRTETTKDTTGFVTEPQA
jgi:hypothetical protein